MNHSVERRDLLIGGAAAAALVAVTSPAAAETLDPHRITVHVLDVYSGKPGANCGSISRSLMGRPIDSSRR
jgi:hypothetical protein